MELHLLVTTHVPLCEPDRHKLSCCTGNISSCDHACRIFVLSGHSVAMHGLSTRILSITAMNTLEDNPGFCSCDMQSVSIDIALIVAVISMSALHMHAESLPLCAVLKLD